MPTIPLRAMGSWLDKVQFDVRQVALDAAVDAARRGVRDIQVVIIPKLPGPPVNRGNYRAGWKFEKLPDGARIYNRTYPQAPLIEFGVRAENVKPGKAMRDAIAEWIAMKGIGPRASESIESVVWAICMGLKKHGIFRLGGSSGFHVIEKAVPIIIKEFEDAFVRRAKRVGG